jgi:hypothetical protein
MILACVHFVSGRDEDGEDLLERLLLRAEKVYVPPVFFAWIATARGKDQEVYRYVERAVEMRDAWLNFNPIAPRQVRAQSPEIQEFLRKKGWA